LGLVRPQPSIQVIDMGMSTFGQATHRASGNTPGAAAAEQAVATTQQASPSGEIVQLLQREGCLSEAQVHHARRVQAKLETPQSLLKILQDLGMVDLEQIRKTLQGNRLSMRIGTLLVELGYLSEPDLRIALTLQANAKDKKKLGEILIESHLISEQKLTEVLADFLDFPYVEPRPSDIDKSLLSKIRPRLCLEHNFIPIVARRDGPITVAFADPLDKQSLGAAQQMLGGEIVPAISRKTLIREALFACERSAKQSNAVADDQTAISVVNGIVQDALRLGASDVHIEPLKNYSRVRLRVDGVMIEQKELSRDLTPSVTSRIKILAQADIAEKRRHQGGRILFEDPDTGVTVDMRASFYVTIHGEKIVLRLLNRKAELLDINEIGMAPRMLERFRHDALDVPTGVVLVTGPTGAGKTTTLYSSVDYLNDPEVSIITAEDPVEYMIDGISQCSINPKINLTFEETLRHIVRQDPDVIVLGEIRDRFSAETAIQAALTGHKVLTTFHTEDSIGGLLRLLNMDIEAFLISSTVVSVVAQRLLRRVCADCAEPYTPTSIDLRRIGYAPQEAVAANFLLGRGCEKCRFTGYRGRVCVFELLVLNEMVKDAILNRKTSYEIRRISVETSGLVTLLEDGLFKAAQGITSLREVARNLPRVSKPRPLTEIRRLSGTA
jgi:type IV pilus assembly protein PilB